MPNQVYAFVLLPILLSVTGCATENPIDDGPHPVWPAAPAQPRIIHRRTIEGIDQVARPSLLDRLGEIFVGSSKQRLAEPNCVALSSDGLRTIRRTTGEQVAAPQVLGVDD